MFTVEIKAINGLLPDPLVAKDSDSGTKKSYSATVKSCDNGNTKDYYSKTYFTSTPSDQHDSVVKKIHAC